MNKVRLIINIIKAKPIPFFAYAFFGAVLNLLTVYSGILLKNIFNVFSGQINSINSIYLLVILMVSIYVARGIMAIIIAYFDATASFLVESLVRSSMFNKIFDQYCAKPLNRPSGEILSIFRDDTNQLRRFIMLISEMISVTAYAIIILVVLIQINIRVTLIVFLPILFVILIIRLGYTKLTNYNKEVRAVTAKSTATLGEVIQSALAIRIAEAEDYVLNNYKKVITRRESISIKESVFTQFLLSTNQNIISIGTGLTLLVAASSFKDGSFTVGDYSLFVFSINIITDITQNISDFLSKVPQAKVSIQRLNSLVDGHFSIQSEKTYPMQPVEALKTLEIKDLCSGYENGSIIIERINFKINRNTLTIITGRMGSGKTTLIRSIIGLLPILKGEILYNNHPIAEPLRFFAPPISAYAPQSPNFISESIKNNILLGLDEYSLDLNKVLYQSVLNEDIQFFENGLETVIGPKGVNLSGGQQKRIAAARIFSHQAELVVFDDITSSIDIETEVEFWDRLLMNKDKTVIAVSNSQYALKRADNIILLKGGIIEAQGKFDELFISNQEFRSICVR